MSYNDQAITERWPSQGDFDIPVSDTTIIEPSGRLLRNNRNIDIEFVFTGMTAADDGMVARIYTGVDPASLTSTNRTETIDPVTIDNSFSGTVTFVRRINGINANLIRIELTSPAGATANLRILFKSAAG